MHDQLGKVNHTIEPWDGIVRGAPTPVSQETLKQSITNVLDEVDQLTTMIDQFNEYVFGPSPEATAKTVGHAQVSYFIGDTRTRLAMTMGQITEARQKIVRLYNEFT